MPRKCGRYFEPFVGGGALFFALRPKNAYISDTNENLIKTYKVVRDNIEALLDDLKKHRNTEEYYYDLRNSDRRKSFNRWSAVRKASRLIYLNKTCYNGLYRVNSSGHFNVPYGYYKNPKILDEENLRSCSKALQETEIVYGSFSLIKNIAKKGDFVYFDPPYAPLSETSSFTNYTSNGFPEEQQFELREVCDFLNQKGVYFMLSNSNTDSIRELYSRYRRNIKTVHAIRAINCKADKRGRIKEVIISNYKND